MDKVDPKQMLYKPKYSPEEEEKFMVALGQILRKAKAGLISLAQAKKEMLAMGTLECDADNFLMHTLRAEELRRLREQEGIIVD